MEMVEKEELERLKDFKVYVFEGDIYVKAKDYKQIAIENRKLKEELKYYKEKTDFLNNVIVKYQEEK